MWAAVGTRVNLRDSTSGAYSDNDSLQCHGACTSTITLVNIISYCKQVTVVTEGSPSAEDMLAALKKWGENANKTVELAE